MSSAVAFDHAHFAMMTGDDEALQDEIRGIFRSQSEIWTRLLVADAPAAVWRDCAHTVKGTARGLGLWALADACERLEALGRAGSIEGGAVSAHMREVRHRLGEALLLLERGRIDV